MSTANQIVLTDPLQETGVTGLSERVALTQKEVGYVQQTAQNVAGFTLRRLKSTWVDNRGGTKAAPIPSLGALDRISCSPFHKGLLSYAFAGQLYAFSGGQLNHSDLICPLWLQVMLVGNGLRRMSTETARYAERLTTMIGAPSPTELSTIYVTDPWKAYRLGLFTLAETLLDSEDSQADDLRLRVRLATSMLEPATLEEINRVALSGSKPRISYVSSAVAYAIKQKRAVPEALVSELAEWVLSAKAHSSADLDAALTAQVLNAYNLYLLGIGKAGEVEANMRFMMFKITPFIRDKERRDHIEGNAHFQRSILARRCNDIDAEIDALLQAMNHDRYFMTLYYRMAQVLHDRGDERAGCFYELALALSPFDLPTANDYGCWLTESSQHDKFDSWVALCQALYPEQFSENSEDQAR